MRVVALRAGPERRPLMAARMLQGVGGALLTPGSLAILQASFRPEDRARAIGAWSGLGGVTSAIGPFVGGWLVDAASWRLDLPDQPSAGARWSCTWPCATFPSPATPPCPAGWTTPAPLLGAVGLAASTYGLIERSWPIGSRSASWPWWRS